MKYPAFAEPEGSLPCP